MSRPPLLVERPQSGQIALALVVPFIFGAVAGIFLGVSEVVYLALSLLAVLGGIAAGFEHVGVLAGAKRGVLGGFLFGSGILIAFELTGGEARVGLPEPAILLIVVTTLIGAALGALGGAVRIRSGVEAGEKS